MFALVISLKEFQRCFFSQNIRLPGPGTPAQFHAAKGSQVEYKRQQQHGPKNPALPLKTAKGLKILHRGMDRKYIAAEFPDGLLDGTVIG